jgi:hypothetical protein
LIRLFVWVILFSYLGFGISVSEFSESSRPSIICFDVFLGFSFAMNVVWLFLTMKNKCVRIPFSRCLVGFRPSYLYNLLCFVIGLLTLMFFIVYTGAHYAINDKSDHAFAAISVLIVGLMLNAALWDLYGNILIRIIILFFLAVCEVSFIVLGSSTAISFDESSNLRAAFIVFFITRTMLNAMWLFVVIPQGSCLRRQDGGSEWRIDSFCANCLLQVFLAFAVLMALVCTSVYTSYVNEEFWKFCQGREPSALLGSSIAFLLVGHAIMLIERHMEYYDRRYGWLVTTLGFLCTLLYGILSWTAAAKYGSVRGDYVFLSTDPPIMCLEEPGDWYVAFSLFIEDSDASDLDDVYWYLEERTSAMRYGIVVVSCCYVFLIGLWWMWSFKMGDLINAF